MAWQANVGTGSGRATDYKDFVTKQVAFLTSKTVTAVVVNNGGATYTVGDVLTLSHASGYLVARFEVTNVSGGVIQAGGLRILSGGAFAVRAVSATVGAAGANYAVNDILELQGGTSREKGKFRVATLSGSGVATVALFETGGSYSSTPSNNASTTKIGPSAGTGSGATLNVTYGTIVGSTNIAVTGGTGTGATVDITLTDVGWTAERNTNSTSFNGVTNEKQVVVKGDAAGRTNKPYVGLATSTATSGINTRYICALHGMIAHNPATALSAQPNILGDPGTWSDGFPYMLFDENQAQEMDFWFGADDSHFRGTYNINSGAASTDNGEYMQFYAGFGDSFATEAEDPYPYFIGASARARNIDPSAVTTSITSLAEAMAPAAPNESGLFYYRTETSTWISVYNSQNNNVNQTVNNCMAPMCQLELPTSAGTNVAPNLIVAYGPLVIYTAIGSTGRGSVTRRLLPVPGSTPKWFPIPLTVLSRTGTTVDDILDTIRLQLRDTFWIYNTNGSAATVTNFSEDYITIGSDRYRVFHNHKNTALYQFICMRESI